jgi:hypothetical protein
MDYQYGAVYLLKVSESIIFFVTTQSPKFCDKKVIDNPYKIMDIM